MTQPQTGRELRSTIDAGGRLRITLEQVAVPAPGPGEVTVRVEAAPINPSDLGLLFGPVDPATLEAEGTADAPVLAAPVDPRWMGALGARIGQSLAVGNEGAGTVVAAGADLGHLVGRTVAMVGGAMYADYRTVPMAGCLLLPEGVAARDGAALFVNPLTALGFVETMRTGGHGAIVHTAAASNLGQMLLRICRAEGIGLVNIVRSAKQAALLRGQGAAHVADMTAPDFADRLRAAIAETGATVAFDAVGGGTLAGDILNAMEAVASARVTEYSRYGSTAPKHVHVYGMLDTGPTILDRRFGFSWDVSGWLLFPFLQRAGAETARRLRERVLAEYDTTFASRYTATVSLADMLRPETAVACARKATGAKYLLDPTLA